MRYGVGRRGVMVVAGVVASLAIVSVATGAGPTYNLKKLKGSITADGSSTVGPYTTATAELFRRAGATGVRVTVGISGTGGGFERFCRGETDLSDASRPMKIKEAQLCKTNNVGSWRAFSVANDALTVVVNKQNTWATCLSTEELKKIWDTGSKVDNWKDIRPGFPDVSLKLFGPGTDSGTFDYFTEVINDDSGASRSDYNASEDDNVLVTGVAGDRSALGYFGYAYYTENQDKLKLVEVDGGDGCVAPSEQTINDGSYSPLSRPIFIYVNKAELERPEVAAFVKFYLENAAELATEVGYVALPQAMYDEGLAAIR